MSFSIWHTSASLLPVSDLFLEAKKGEDVYPLGTIKQYGKDHLYVKVAMGGKKPWVYYATLGKEKASAAIKAGGVIVSEGKPVGPATSANLKLWKVPHPFAGKPVPPLLPGGKPLGAVSADGDFEHDPEGMALALSAGIASGSDAPSPTAPAVLQKPPPAPTMTATPATAPPPEDAKLGELVKYLKDVGFDDAKQAKRLQASPVFADHMLKTFGADWVAKYQQATGSAASPPAPPEVSVAAAVAAALGPAPKKKKATKKKPVAVTLGPGVPAGGEPVLGPGAGGVASSLTPKQQAALLKDVAAMKQHLKLPTVAHLNLDAMAHQALAATHGENWYDTWVNLQISSGLPEPATPEPMSAPIAPSTGAKAKEAPAPGPVPPTSGGVGLVASVLPNLSDLKYSGPAKIGGAGKKDFYKDAQGNVYLIKIAVDKTSGAKAKPYAAVAQEMFSNVATAVRPDHVPVKTALLPDGTMVTIQPYYVGVKTVENVEPASLSDQEKQDVAQEHVLDWLMSQHDSYGGNLLRKKDGSIVGVDKEQAFRFFPDDKLDVGYNPNPIEPYYNQFWRAFRDNQMDFDPTSMKAAIEAVEAISDTDYQAQLEKYAQSLYPTETAKRAKFLKAALDRKHNLRADFESFVTDLYRKRAGKKNGVFSFGQGWDEGGKKSVATPKKKNIQKINSKAWAAHLSLKEYPFQPSVGPEAGKNDPTKIVLKLSKGSGGTGPLEQFAKDMGLTPIGQPPIITGSNYHLAVFDKAAYDAAEIEKELEKPIEIDPEDSTALVEIDPHKPAEMNNQELKTLDAETALGPLGKRFASDSIGVEGQYMRVKRVIDEKGEPYYLFQYKLRPVLADTISAGNKHTAKFPQLAYQPGQDAMAEQGGYLSHTDGTLSLSGEKWTHGKSEAVLYRDDKHYTFKNSMLVKVRPKKGQTPYEAFEETLDAVKPGLAKDLLRNPTPEEQEIARLARLLWAASPQEADKLQSGDYTVAGLKARLGKLGYGDAETAKIEERETYPGLHSHVLPGRHKKLGKGKFRFIFNGISDAGAALSILKHGLLGISERAALGIPLKGGSVPQDIDTGAGDQILTRAVTENGFGTAMSSHPFAGEFQAIIDPAEADRLDSYMHSGDAFGSCNPGGYHGSEWKNRKTVEKVLEGMASSYHTSAELCFRKGIARSKILRIVTSSEAKRKNLIQLAKAAGIVEVNNVSIESFVVVAHTTGDAFTKCVQPVLEKAAKKVAK